MLNSRSGGWESLPPGLSLFLGPKASSFLVQQNMEQQTEVGLQKSLILSLPSKEIEESMDTALASRCSQQCLCWGKAVKRTEKALSGFIIPDFSPQVKAFPEFFITRCNKALTPVSLISPLLTRDNRVGVTTGQNILGYTMILWFGRGRPSKRDCGYFTCFVKHPAYVRSRLICSFFYSLSINKHSIEHIFCSRYYSGPEHPEMNKTHSLLSKGLPT